MHIRLAELRKVIRGVLKEALPSDRPTISSELDPDEKELMAKYPHWGNPQAEKVKQASPAQVKAKQVAKILQAKGLTADAAHKKKVTYELLPFIEKMDPGDMFVADPDDIAVQFAAEVLGVKQD
jgi:hypothetical protein